MLELLIKSNENFDTSLGYLVSMLNTVRNSTIYLTKDLSIDALDRTYDKSSNSIGTLLFHIAYIEFSTIYNLFEKKELPTAESTFWEPGRPERLSEKLVCGKSFDYYFEILTKTRIKTLKYLESVDDEWLLKTNSTNSLIRNNYFSLFHIMEDEIGHRGQILFFKKRLSI